MPQTRPLARDGQRTQTNVATRNLTRHAKVALPDTGRSLTHSFPSIGFLPLASLQARCPLTLFPRSARCQTKTMAGLTSPSHQCNPTLQPRSDQRKELERSEIDLLASLFEGCRVPHARRRPSSPQSVVLCQAGSELLLSRTQENETRLC